MSKRSRGERPSQSKTRRPVDGEWPEVMTLGQACEYLGVSRTKITKLVQGGVLKFCHNELDRREKLVQREALDDLLKRKSRPE